MKKNSKKRLGGGFGGGRAILALAAFSAFAAPALYASTAMASCSISGTMALNTSGVLEDCTVTQGGVYDVTEYGGAGGAVSSDYASGAEISAQFSLTAGQEFELVTGAAGASYNGVVVASGGGGTFFVLDSSGALTPYLVAGGGGGAGTDNYSLVDGQPGQVSGNPALESGEGGVAHHSAGGGGYIVDGDSYFVPGGNSFVGQAVGSSAAGNGGTGYLWDSADYMGGGGGGYDGGYGSGFNNTNAGGGGTNYYNPSLATDVTQVAGTTATGTPTAGQIDFTLASGTPVPEPPAFTIFLLAVSGLFMASRLRRGAAGASGA